MSTDDMECLYEPPGDTLLAEVVFQLIRCRQPVRESELEESLDLRSRESLDRFRIVTMQLYDQRRIDVTDDGLLHEVRR